MQHPSKAHQPTLFDLPAAHAPVRPAPLMRAPGVPQWTPPVVPPTGHEYQEPDQRPGVNRRCTFCGKGTPETALSYLRHAGAAMAGTWYKAACPRCRESQSVDAPVRALKLIVVRSAC